MQGFRGHRVTALEIPSFARFRCAHLRREFAPLALTHAYVESAIHSSSPRGMESRGKDQVADQTEASGCSSFQPRCTARLIRMKHRSLRGLFKRRDVLLTCTLFSDGLSSSSEYCASSRNRRPGGSAA